MFVPKTSLPSLFIGLVSVWVVLHTKRCHQPNVCRALRNHPPSVLSLAEPRLPFPVSSQAHNCTSHVVSASSIFRSVNVLAIRRSWVEEIKDLNKRVELKHTSLTQQKLCITDPVYFELYPKNRILFIFRGQNKKSPTKRGREIFVKQTWQLPDLQPNYAIPHKGT